MERTPRQTRKIALTASPVDAIGGTRVPRRFLAVGASRSQRWAIYLSFLATLALSCGGLLPASAAVYRWVDAQGQVHFSDQAPTGSHPPTLDLPTAPAPPITNDEAARRAKQQRLLRAWSEEDRQQAAAQAKAARQQAMRQKRCALARDRLRSYRQARYLYDLDAQGKRRILSDSEYQQALQQAQDAVTQWCE